MATIEFIRTGKYAYLRKLTIEVDGQPAVRLSHGAEAAIDVAAGRHSIMARMDWARSPLLEVDCEATDTIRIEVGVPGLLLATIRTFLSPGKVFELRVRSG